MRTPHAVHLTSVHDRYDVRIFLKECTALSEAGWSVTLVVADGLGDEVSRGVNIVDVGRRSGRLSRMGVIPLRMFKAASGMDAQVYHLHDPELLPIGWRLKRRGTRVVFDSHEDVAKDILGKAYLPAPVRKLISRVYSVLERWSCSRFDAVVAATPAIRREFEAFHPVVVDVNNYPLPEEIVASLPAGERHNEVCYVGGISAARGVVALVQAMALVTRDTKLLLIGEFMGGSARKDVEQLAGWRNVVAPGQLPRQEVRAQLANALAGVVTYLPEPNHVNAQPNKLFEYMGAGVAVIASDFPLWRRIVEGHDCGVCVDPQDPVAIAQAIDLLASDPARAARLGGNGLQAVRQHYNWPAERTKLLDLYAGWLT